MFDVGTKLVCIDDRFPNCCKAIYPVLPRKGQRYTVRDVVAGQELNLQRTVAILLDEIQSPPNPHGIEPGFAPWRFAEASEVVTLQDEATATIGTFTSILSANKAILAADPDLAEFRRRWERLKQPVKTAMFRMLEGQRMKNFPMTCRECDQAAPPVVTCPTNARAVDVNDMTGGSESSLNAPVTGAEKPCDYPGVRMSGPSV